MHREDPGLEALVEGRAFVDLSGHRKVRVGGTDAASWLHDLVTAPVAGLEPGEATRSLVLTPTGRIRADIHVVRTDDGFVLLQDPDQPEHIGLVLAPYVLSSDVVLEDATGSLASFAIPGAGASLVGHPGSSPSILGEGIDVLVGAGKPAWRFEDTLVRADLTEADAQAAERWRIMQGRPKMGRDFSDDSLPAEVGLEHVIDWTKGCFLGQESVAKVRNLGHPPWLVMACSVLGTAEPGDALLVGGAEIGHLTSVAPADPRSWAVCRLRWEARAEIVTLPDGRIVRTAPPG